MFEFQFWRMLDILVTSYNHLPSNPIGIIWINKKRGVRKMPIIVLQFLLAEIASWQRMTCTSDALRNTISKKEVDGLRTLWCNCVFSHKRRHCFLLQGSLYGTWQNSTLLTTPKGKTGRMERPSRQRLNVW